VHPVLPLLLICAGIFYAELTVIWTPLHSHFNFFALRGM
jgi:hypothetical protein